MRLAIGAARMFFWDFDLLTNQVTWSDGLEEACGLTKGGFDGTVDAFRALVHPDDAPAVEQALGEAIAGIREYDTEFRMLRPDGGMRWVVARATVLRDGAGRPLRMVGIDFDITDPKVAEAALAESEAHLRNLIDALPAFVFVTDPDGSNLYQNRRFLEYANLDAGAAAGNGRSPGAASGYRPERRLRSGSCRGKRAARFRLNTVCVAPPMISGAGFWAGRAGT